MERWLRVASPKRTGFEACEKNSASLRRSQILRTWHTCLRALLTTKSILGSNNNPCHNKAQDRFNACALRRKGKSKAIGFRITLDKRHNIHGSACAKTLGCMQRPFINPSQRQAPMIQFFPLPAASQRHQAYSRVLHTCRTDTFDARQSRLASARHPPHHPLAAQSSDPHSPVLPSVAL